MPRVVAHATDGMRILPLVVRPCPWRLEEELRSLQARPLDGRALSLGTDAQIDLDLATFVYELAATLDQVPGDLVSQEWERAAKGVSIGPYRRCNLQRITEATDLDGSIQQRLRNGPDP
jgi:hypothetical protein